MHAIVKHILGKNSPRPRPDVNRLPSELRLFDEHSMSGIQVINRQYALARDVVVRGIEGDFVECGVCDGGSAAAISFGLSVDSRRHAWLYDSFEGLPEGKEIDGPGAKEWPKGSCRGAEEKVHRVMAAARVLRRDYTIRKGWFKDTFSLRIPDKICFLHVDADWYDSVLLSLETFHDRVVDGGIILLDDFGYWEGCREAFYDFIAARRLKPVLERFGSAQAYWVKGREHNRDLAPGWEMA
jgi:O-methyltransferase